MGGKQSKEAVDMSSPKYNVYDTFNNNTNIDKDNSDYIKDYINPYFYVYSVIMAIFYVYSVIMAILLGYNIVLYSSIYIRRYYISNSRVK
jgi:hypothetical protein